MGRGGTASGFDHFAYCARELRAGDRDRYLADLFAAAEQRPRLMALHAFDLELARIPDMVSEPALGEIRLQWWREAIAAIYEGRHIDHPVVAALAVAISAARLPRAPVDAMLEAMSFNLYGDPAPDLVFLEGHAGETTASMIALGCQILKPGMDAADVAGHAGVALHMTRIMRGLQHLRARGQVHVPRALLEAHGASVADVLAGQNAEAVRAALHELCRLARGHLAEARQWGEGLPAEALPALLPVSLCALYLDRIEADGFDPYGPPPAISQLRRQWHMWRAARRGRF